MWKLGRGRVLLDEPPEEEDGLRGGPPPAAAAAQAQVQGASFRGWKEVTSLFNKDDEQHLLERCKSPKSKGTNLRLKEELKAEKKSGFWDNLVLKQNIQSKKPDEIEGWEPPKLALEDISADPEDTMGGHPSWSGWEDDAKGSTKYTSLASSANSSRWSLRSAGRLRLSVVPSLCFSRAVSWYLFCKQRARDVAHDVGQVPAVLPLRSRKEVTAVKMQVRSFDPLPPANVSSFVVGTSKPISMGIRNMLTTLRSEDTVLFPRYRDPVSVTHVTAHHLPLDRS
ncbi:testis development-related protein isoform X1 [Papio anubis]|uniref:testis development-related protein isoform X1 n=1 Tax=Papio anubis TaxID=9555 RepID=UPI000B7B4FC5|nr:testis development-related protein isoform X1 [Papio anubis]